MKQLYLFIQRLWRKEPCRWCLAVTFAALMGIAAGHTVLGVSGSVSVVDGTSMLPTYQPGARVFTVPISTSPGRGDVVLVDDGKPDYALKRIIGLPSERIQIWRGYVFVNRKMLREPYLAKHTYTAPDQGTEISTFKLGDDQYFVLGDNRDSSVDSRVYGPVARKQIKSRVPLPVTRATFVGFTLPVPGSRTIRPL
jgi:signal peptidase I